MLRSAILSIVLLALLGACTSEPVDDPSASNTVITLRRGVCMGSCPVYEVTIDGDGKVTFDGGYFVAVATSIDYRISTRDVADLLEKFKAADFFSLEDRYDAGVDDAPTYEISLQIDGRKKTVIDSMGSHVGAPAGLQDLEREIDRVAGTRRWIVLGPDTVEGLKEQDISADSQILADGFACSLESISDDQAFALLQAGIRANGTCPAMGSERSSVEVAAAGGRLALMRKLLSLGGMRDASAEVKRGVLCAAVLSGEPEILAEILALHPDLQSRCWGIPLIDIARTAGRPGTPKIVEMLKAASAESPRP
ncbi:hypothetical protein D3874_23930 [Oleomonas cavernae]|uniref:DUF6438 domain-containing protein n=2 Tax=Oleomonas cavernae TaxID=2320859 RepID=A0A418WHX7_9PROT|nr:hypothetical protein D3874_23930 [Oleomonas cavernae]